MTQRQPPASEDQPKDVAEKAKRPGADILASGEFRPRYGAATEGQQSIGRDAEGRRRPGQLGDIAGKGIAGALLMANLQANLRSQCAMALDQPQRFLRSVNQLFFENTVDSAYATLFFAEYDDRTGRLRYANCGHLCALLLRRDGTLERLDSTCPVLGLFKTWDCAIDERGLFPGDTLAVYTDGVTEAFNDAEEEYGEKRLIAALRRHRKQESQAMVAAIVDEVREFGTREQYDDITLIVAKCR